MKKWLPKILFSVLWIIIWGVIALIVNKELVLAGPVEVSKAFLAAVTQATFWITVGTSLLHIIIGFIVAMILGCALAFVSSRFQIFSDFISPVIHLAKSAPIVCFVVLILIWFGSDNVDIVTIIISVIPVYYLAMTEAVTSRDKNVMSAMKLFCVPKATLFKTYLWPNGYPFFSQATKSAIGLAWKSGVTAQMIGAASMSIGAGVSLAKYGMDSSTLIMWMFVVIALSFICEKLIMLVIKQKPKGSGEFNVAHICNSPITIVLNNLCIKIKNTTIIDNLSFKFEAGKRYSISGRSGIGKSTLVQALTGLLKTDSSQIQIIDDKTNCLQDLKNQRIFSGVLQDSSLNPYLDIKKNLELVNALPNNEDTKWINLVINDWHAFPSQLSGGMKRCIEIVRAIQAESQIVVLDEPFAGLDKETKQHAIKYINSNINNRTLVLITHDKNDSKQLECQDLSLS